MRVAAAQLLTGVSIFQHCAEGLCSFLAAQKVVNSASSRSGEKPVSTLQLLQ